MGLVAALVIGAIAGLLLAMRGCRYVADRHPPDGVGGDGVVDATRSRVARLVPR